MAVALALTGEGGTAGAQIIPTTTTTSEPEQTTTTATSLLETTTTAPAESTTTVPAQTTVTTGTARTTTTAARGPTTTAFVPPTGVAPTTTAPAAAEEVLDADLGKLPLFVGLSLFGIFVSIAIVSVQWVRTRP